MNAGLGGYTLVIPAERSESRDPSRGAAPLHNRSRWPSMRPKRIRAALHDNLPMGPGQPAASGMTGWCIYPPSSSRPSVARAGTH